MSFRIQNFNLSIAETLICKDLSFEIKPTEFWGILGVNGVGKSTLLHQIINVDISMNNFSKKDIHLQEKNGIFINDKPLSSFKHHRKALAIKTGLLLQEYDYNFPCTVFEAALIGRHPYLSQWQWENKDDIEITEAALAKTHLSSFKNRMTNTLSGGEKRRLNIATLLTQDPDYLLLDEPTNHLDLSAQIQILSLLKKHIQTQNKGGLMVIHDANLAKRYCDNVLMLFGEGEWAAGPVDTLINVKNLSRLYDCPIQALSNDSQTVYIAG